MRHLFLLATLATLVEAIAYEVPVFPFAPAAGEPGSSAIERTDPAIRGWVTKVAYVHHGEDVAEEWKTRSHEAVLGPASGNPDDVIVLGRGGEVLLTFWPPLHNGDGYDFAVFENGIRDTFLELAHIEVSSDGIHFVRFPGYSLTAEPVPAFGDVQPTFVHGLASKYRLGFGTPFDLETLAEAHQAALTGGGGFSAAFASQLLENYPFLDLARVTHLRIVDIPGDGSEQDCEGFPVYDPYPTVITAGFDLEAVGVFHTAEPDDTSYVAWCARYGLSVGYATDGDRDGWPQYMEFLMDSDPTDRRSKPAIASRIDPEDGILEITYRRRNFPVRVLVSVDARQWDEAPEEPEIVDSPEDGGLIEERLRLALPENGATLYFRLSAKPVGN